MEFLNDYISLIILGVCLCAGYVLKNIVSTDKVNKFIPMIMAIIGVAMNIWINDFAFTPEILLTGLFSGLASTGMHQAFTQLVNETAE